MRSFWLFRSNIKHLEYYHDFKDLKTFKNHCHDYYLLLPLWLLENNYFDEVIIWRLSKNKIPDITFNINGKKYIQRWVMNFSDVFDYPAPDFSFFRGGFREYDEITRNNNKKLGTRLYLGAGHRITPQWGGKYDVLLMEDERDFIKGRNCLPFFKTASPYIFYPLQEEKKWDICWPVNFAQTRQKGQDFFINLISTNKELQKLKIVCCGNKPGVGRQMCEKYKVTNIKFTGEVDRPTLNKYLNQSKFGLNASNMNDGCPRVSTEIIMSGQPLIIRDETRLLDYFKKDFISIVFNQKNVTKKINWAMKNYGSLVHAMKYNINREFSFDTINQRNIELWKKI
jgi:hypothetical protein